MAGRVRHLVNRSGRYHARLVVPRELRGIIGKTELRIALGGDYREALKKLPRAVTQLQHQIALAERQAAPQRPSIDTVARYPLTPEQLAASHYRQRLELDELFRSDPRYASVAIDDLFVSRLGAAIAGKASDKELSELVGPEIERFRAAGNLDCHRGTDAWRKIARSLCRAELEALARAFERDEGDFSGQPTDPMLVGSNLPEKDEAPVSLELLWSDYVVARKRAGFMRDGGRRQTPVIKNLRKFLTHDNARKVTRKNILAWRDHLMTSLSAKTVSDIYLSTARSLFAWAVENELLPGNPVETVRQAKPRKVLSRENGYSDAEAIKILRASRSYQPNADGRGRVREKSHLVATKRWVPMICAFTGARVSEITQLRKEDFRKEDGVWIARITPAAGTVKAGNYRDVPLHAQVIAEGFGEFIECSGAGPLFHGGSDREDSKRKAARIGNQLATWLGDVKLKPEGIQPNHAWRHRFKTQCRELGISDRVVDAIQGHSAKTAGDAYGGVTLKTKADAIARLPYYEIR